MSKSEQKGNKYQLKIKDQNMYPLLQMGDIATFKKTSFTLVKPNDLVLITRKNSPIVRRIILKNDEYCITKIDGGKMSDNTVITAHSIIYAISSVKRRSVTIDLYEGYAVQSSVYWHQILVLMDSFKKNHIDFVFLKGLPLHLYYEKNYPKHMYTDCDILVNPFSKNKLEGAFHEMGYVKENDSSPSFQRFAQHEEIELDFTRKVSGIIVRFDVHYSVSMSTVHFNGLRKKLGSLSKEMLMTKKYVSIDSKRFPLLKEDLLILYLLLHQVNHSWKDLKGAVFINTIVNSIAKKRKGHIDWKVILDTAKKYSILNFIIPGLYLQKIYFTLCEPLIVCQKVYRDNYLYTMKVFNTMYEDIYPNNLSVTKIKTPLLSNKFTIRFSLYDATFMTKCKELFNIKFFVYLFLRAFKKSELI